jgi:ABC-type lipoprotein release transport system permease subunit
MILLKMAFRNIFRHKRRSLFTGMMMAGGFILFSVSLGVIEGSYSTMIEMYTHSRAGHVQIHKKGYLDKPSIYDSFTNPAQTGAQIEAVPEVISWAPRLYAPALAFIGKKTTGVQIIGIDPRRESRTTVIRERLKEGTFLSGEHTNKVMIGTGLAKILHAGVNDEIALIGQSADGSIANELFLISGILEGEDRSSLYMHLSAAQDFLFLSGRVHEIAIILTHHSYAENAARVINETLGDRTLDAAPWQLIEKQFYRAMQLDRKSNWITQFIIMLIVAIGVLNTVLMTLLERTREFGILRSVGTRPYQIFALILLETGFLSIISIVAAGALSLILNYLLAVYGIELPTPIELAGLRFESYVSAVTVETVLLPAIVTFSVALAVSAFPALRAARISPVKALRAE